jgi:hypothetical protein
MTKLAICIPTYNRNEMFFNLLNQLILQINTSIYKNDIEICISDNCSEIDITENLNLVLKNNPDIKIRINKFNKNMGIMYNIRHIVNMSSSEYCWIIGNDDKLADDTVIDLVMEKLYEPKTIEIITFPFFHFTGTEHISLYPSHNNMDNKIFDLKCKSDYDLWFNGIYDKLGNNSGLFIFIASVIFKKRNWEKFSHDCDWDINSVYYQAFIHIKTLLNYGKLIYIKNPLVIRNGTFDSDITNNIHYCFNCFCDMYDFVSYFFKGDLRERLLKEFIVPSYYFAIRNSNELTITQEQRIINISKNVDHLKIINSMYLSAHKYSTLKDKILLAFGSGNFGNIIKEKLETHGIHISYFIDNDKNKQGMIINEIEVISPEKALEILDSYYLITILIPEIIQKVYDQLIDMGISKDRIIFCGN